MAGSFVATKVHLPPAPPPRGAHPCTRAQSIVAFPCLPTLIPEPARFGKITFVGYWRSSADGLLVLDRQI